MNRTSRFAGATIRVAGMSALVGTVLLSAGCASGHSTAMTGAASTILTNDANGLATAADTGSASQLSVAAAKMRSDVVALQASGALSSTRAADVLAQVQRVVADASLVPIAASPVASAAAPTAGPTAGPPGAGHGKKDGGPPPGHDKPHG